MQVALSLGQLGEAAAPAVGALTVLLKDSDERVRGAAVQALGAAGEKAHKTAGLVAAVLTDDPSAAVRRAAAATLTNWRLHDRDVRAALIVGVGDDDEGVSAASVQGLSTAPLDEVALAALEGAVTDRRASVACVAAERLARSGPQGCRRLCELLRCGGEGARLHALVALTDLGPVGKDAAPALAALLKDAEGEFRGRVATALGAVGVGGPEVRPLLEGMLKDDPNPDNRTAAATALGRLKFRDAAPALREALQKDDDEQVRRSAAKALADLVPRQ
jgi:HEAT repeat protein